MKHRRVLALGLASGLAVAACAKVPFTNRTIFSVIPRGTMSQLGLQQYNEVLKQSAPEKGTRDVARLREVGRRLSTAVNRTDFDWRYNLLKDKTINAWCMPGGYIAFYTGILPVLQNESAMAFVMGHEVGHAVANHSAERMTAQLGVQGALTLIDALLTGSGKVSAQNGKMIQAALGLGAQVGVLLPFSRQHENEADVLGIMYMAKAGYPPGQSIPVWDRMTAAAGKGPPAFLSDHPSNEHRKEHLAEWLPQARKAFQRSQRVGPAATESIW